MGLGQFSSVQYPTLTIVTVAARQSDSAIFVKAGLDCAPQSRSRGAYEFVGRHLNQAPNFHSHSGPQYRRTNKEKVLGHLEEEHLPIAICQSLKERLQIPNNNFKNSIRSSIYQPISIAIWSNAKIDCAFYDLLSQAPS